MQVPSGCRFHPRCPRFLGDLCRDHEPPWQEGEGDHRVYCHIRLDELLHLQAETIILSGDQGGE
jgi:peptide/nickel transport system ATP-binding protein